MSMPSEPESDLIASHMRRWRREFSLDGKLLGIGIDRLDYTKGIPERLRFLDRLLQKYPAYRGKLVFLQIAVPSRSALPAYQQIEEEVDRLAAQINLRWGTPFWRPVIVLKRNYSLPEMIALHRLAQFCVVASLHDGMNLVAKEFVASRVDGDGVLVLSKFTGAASGTEGRDTNQSVFDRAGSRSPPRRAPDASRGASTPHAKDAGGSRAQQRVPMGWQISLALGDHRVPRKDRTAVSWSLCHLAPDARPLSELPYDRCRVGT